MIRSGLRWLAAVMILGMPLEAGGGVAGASATLVFYATGAGKLALDQDDGGGNPFAGALLEGLARPHETLAGLSRDLSRGTAARSGGRQVAEVPRIEGGVERLDLKAGGARRVALVVGVSEYQRVPSLPGVAHDVRAIAAALTANGFETRAVLDGKLPEIEEGLRDFSVRSRTADVSLIYATGHSIEIADGVRLILGEFAPSKGKAGLAAGSLPLSALVKAGQAKRANLVMYGGCRNNPYGW